MARLEHNKHGNPRLLRGEILSRWVLLTTNDIEGCETDLAKLSDVLQTRYGYAKRRAEKEAELFFGEFEHRLRLTA